MEQVLFGDGLWSRMILLCWAAYAREKLDGDKWTRHASDGIDERYATLLPVTSAVGLYLYLAGFFPLFFRSSDGTQ